MRDYCGWAEHRSAPMTIAKDYLHWTVGRRTENAWRHESRDRSRDVTAAASETRCIINLNDCHAQLLSGLLVAQQAKYTLKHPPLKSTDWLTGQMVKKIVRFVQN